MADESADSGSVGPEALGNPAAGDRAEDAALGDAGGTKSSGQAPAPQFSMADIDFDAFRYILPRFDLAFEEGRQEVDRGLWRFLGVATIILAAVLWGVVTYAAIHADDNSARQDLFVELSAGCVIFLLVPLIIKLESSATPPAGDEASRAEDVEAPRFHWRVPVISVIIFVASAIGVFQLTGVAQAYCVEVFGAALLAILLDLTVQRWVMHCFAAAQACNERIAAIRQDMEDSGFQPHFG